MELLGRIEYLTTGERSSEDIRRYVTDYLFATLDSDKSGTVDLQELEKYLSTYGLVANLNVVSAAASPATTEESAYKLHFCHCGEMEARGRWTIGIDGFSQVEKSAFLDASSIGLNL
ncbi:hypothetical protein [Microcoleus sp. N9_A1]|uniref:hypothetical protein n=1 Tax=Microcoleus sp. N9_A1 TaxID=3055380 RepID=UPI002FD4283B